MHAIGTHLYDCILKIFRILLCEENMEIPNTIKNLPPLLWIHTNEYQLHDYLRDTDGCQMHRNCLDNSLVKVMTALEFVVTTAKHYMKLLSTGIILYTNQTTEYDFQVNFAFLLLCHAVVSIFESDS